MIKDFVIAAKSAESAKNLGRCTPLATACAAHCVRGIPRPPKNFATFAFFAAKKLFATALITLCSASANALPLTWRADWPDAKPVETLVHRGTDVELQPLWRINKEPADTNGWTFTTFCQTNAVGPWFGPMPGAFFSHTNDVGAAFYNVMVRAQTPGGEVNYTAFARLRMLDSPGFAPGELPLPVATIDFSKVVALNAPWTLQTDFSTATNTLSAAIGGLAQNLAANYYTAAETDDAIDSLAAYYITYTAAGAAFPSRAALLNATVVYSGGAARTPTRNDYAVVLADESHGGAEWRYIYTVAAGATSGQWDAQYPIETNDYDGLSNKPQINGVSLSDDKTGADLGVLDLAGGTMTGPLSTPQVNITRENYLTWSMELDDAVGGFHFKAPALPGVFGAVDLILPRRPDNLSGTLALSSDIDAAISPTSPAFSNAVLSVGLGIDTDTVAVINELVDSAHDLPVTGATSVGALLLALAAAVAALKKKFGYDTEDSAASATIALSTRTFPVVDATAKTSADTIAVTMPSSTADGKVSDMCLRIDTGASVPALTFDLSDNVFIPANGDDAWGTLEASSHNVFSFTSSGTQTVAVTDAANGNAVTNVTKRMWIVGRVTAPIVAAETINES